MGWIIDWQLPSEESLLLETLETGIRPPIEEEYTTPVAANL